MSAAQSGGIGNGGESWLEAVVTGPGILTFWWKVSSETNWDWLEFDSLQQTNRFSGEVDWQQQVVDIPSGLQTLRWRYFKDPECCADGMDAGWLAQVSFVATEVNSAPVLPVQTN